jgi:hypothetical protein
MVVVGVLLTPVVKMVSLLCSVDPAYAHKKNVTDQVDSLPFKNPIYNIIIFPKNVPAHARSLGDWRCKRCSSDKFVVRSENRICRFCGESSYYEAEGAMILATSPCYRGFNDNANKRVTHFKNWVSRLQGKERCNITSVEMDEIKNRIMMYPDSISEFKQIRMAMKELGLQRYYNNVYYVMKYCMGHALVRFSKLNEARLLAMFLRIQEPFSRITRKRTNMLSYQFLIKKFCELLGYKVSQFIPNLKSRNNLQQQDFLWKQICDQLGLPFYASV